MLTLGSARDIVFELKDNKIMVKSKEFTAAGGTFTTLKTIKLLDKASLKGKVKATVETGNSVIVKKIKYVKDGEAYLYIQYGSKKGWYHLKDNIGFVFKL
ncbi:MAG: hypothetical protein K0R31_2536, partial [Clostridiales bacterium]|nr:hypothetical protein [Clostridiales bacterium]